MDNFIPLESIHIANPCSADWDKMHGDDRARFCQSCEKHVYNLSDMTRADAEKLVNDKEGRLCVQFYQRADGTILTDDCPIPLRRARNGARWIWRGAVAGISAVAALFAGLAARNATAKPAAKTAKTTAKHTRTAGAPMMRPKKNPPPIAMMGAPAPPPRKVPPKKVAPAKHPQNAPLMGKPTMGEPMPQPTPPPQIRGEIAPRR